MEHIVKCPKRGVWNQNKYITSITGILCKSLIKTEKVCILYLSSDWVEVLLEIQVWRLAVQGRGLAGELGWLSCGESGQTRKSNYKHSKVLYGQFTKYTCNFSSLYSTGYPPKMYQLSMPFMAILFFNDKPPRFYVILFCNIYLFKYCTTGIFRKRAIFGIWLIWIFGKV